MTTTHTPKASKAIASLLTLLAVAAFLGQVTDVLLPATVGLVGVGLLAVSLRIVDSGTAPAQRLVASLLSVPIAAGFVVGVFGTTLVLTGAFFPVEDVADVSLATLLVIGHLGIVVGVTLAVFGVTLEANDIAAPRALTAYTTTAFLTAVIPLVVGLILVLPSVFSDRGPPLLARFGGVGTAWQALVAPSGPHLHLGSFLVAVGLTATVLWLFVDRVPLETLLADSGERTYRRLQRARKIPHRVTAGAIILFPFAILVEVAIPPTELEATLGPVFGLVQAVTTAGWLRLLMLVTATAAGVWIAASTGLQTVEGQRTAGSREWLVPFAVGGTVTVVAAIVAESVFAWIVATIARQLPPELAAAMLERSTRIEIVYGETPIVVLLSGLFVSLAAVIGLGFRLAVQVGYLTPTGTGFSIACSGLLLAVISAAIISAPTWLVLGGVLTALTVWDIGRFGTELGREVASGASSQLVTIRTGWTLLIGAGGVGIVVALQRFVVQEGATVSSSTTLALLSFVTAILAFAIALR